MTTVNAMQGPGGVAAMTVDETSTVTGAATILPDPVGLSGDLGAELAALAVRSGEQQETVAQTARDAEERIEVNQDDRQVDAMHKKAGDVLSDGLTEGLGMMAEGGFELAAAGETTAAEGKPTADGYALKADGTICRAWSMTGDAFSKAAQANDDATAAAARSASDRARSAADDLHDAKKGAGDFISAALDFYREYTSAKAAADAAALGRA